MILPLCQLNAKASHKNFYSNPVNCFTSLAGSKICNFRELMFIWVGKVQRIFIFKDPTSKLHSDTVFKVVYSRLVSCQYSNLSDAMPCSSILCIHTHPHVNNFTVSIFISLVNCQLCFVLSIHEQVSGVWPRTIFFIYIFFLGGKHLKLKWWDTSFMFSFNKR